MSLQVHLVFQGHLTEVATKRLLFLNVLQVLPSELFVEIAFTAKFVYSIFDWQIGIAKASTTTLRPLLFVHRPPCCLECFFVKLCLALGRRGNV